MEAFVESIYHLEHLSDKRYIIHTFMAAQAKGKEIERFVKKIPTAKSSVEDRQAKDADEFLQAFQAGFKGLD